MTIKMLDHVGKFASNKDIAKKIRMDMLLPALSKKQGVVMDFYGVEGATQSFVHALISEAMRRYGADNFLDLVSFKLCNKNIQSIITIVTDYMQAGLEDG